MEERLDHVRTEVSFVLYCTTIGRYVEKHQDGHVCFSPFAPEEFKTPEDADEARRICRKAFNACINPAVAHYRLSIRRWEFKWKPCGRTQLKETPITIKRKS